MSQIPTTIRLPPMEQAMMWERMSGERLSDGERKRITHGGAFFRPTPQAIASHRPEAKTGDHLGRTDKDFAIEFGGYLANEAERFMQHHNERTYVTSDEADEGVDRWNALKSAIYEFRKRAERART